MLSITYRGFTITFARSPDFGDLINGSFGCTASVESLNLKEYGDDQEEASISIRREIDDLIKNQHVGDAKHEC
jgi:hypothetical protein